MLTNHNWHATCDHCGNPFEEEVVSSHCSKDDLLRALRAEGWTHDDKETLCELCVQEDQDAR